MRLLNALPHTLLAAAVLGTTACGRDGADDFLDAIPSEEDVEVKVPGDDGDGQALSAGERSPFYEVTYNVSRGVNAHVKAIFVVMRAIVQNDPTTEEENKRVWGPSEPRGLERLSYRFTVEKLGESEFAYALEARDKGEESEDAFRVIWEGNALPEGEGLGTGDLTLYLDNDDNDCSNGTAFITYAKAADERLVDVEFDGVHNSCNGERGEAATYHYREDSEGAGDFAFAVVGNIHADEENKPGDETWTIKSRWLASGAGRSDVTLTGDEVDADLEAALGEDAPDHVTAVECWDDLFALTHADTTPEELRPHVRELIGDASMCAIDADGNATDASADPA